MNLTDDAMQVSLRITAWSGRLYDRQASNHVAVHHDAAASAGRYNKRLLPKAAFAALTGNHEQDSQYRPLRKTLPWDDQGLRLLTVANYERYTELMDGFRERIVRERARFIEDYDENIDQARLDLGKLFRIEDYPSKEALRGKFAIRYRISPVQDAEQFMAKLATDDVDRVRRDIEQQIEERLHGAVGDLYRRFGEAVERVSERLQEDDNGKPLVFRDSMIENIRELVDVVPRLNIFGDDDLARLCEQVKDKIASVDPDTLRPSRSFDPVARTRVKRDADALMERFAGYFAPPAEPTPRLPRSPRGRPRDGRPRADGIRAAHQRHRDRAPAQAALLRQPRAQAPAPRRPEPRDAGERRARDPLLAPMDRGHRCACHRDRDGARGDGLRLEASHAPGRARPGALAAGLAARHPRARARRGLHPAARGRGLGRAQCRAGLRPPARAGRRRPRRRRQRAVRRRSLRHRGSRPTVAR